MENDYLLKCYKCGSQFILTNDLQTCKCESIIGNLENNIPNIAGKNGVLLHLNTNVILAIPEIASLALDDANNDIIIIKPHYQIEKPL